MSSGPYVPPGQSPPFATVTDTDHCAWIIIATALGLTFTLLSSILTVSIRLTITPGWGIDDAALALSTILSWMQSSIILAACSKGLGKSLKLIPLAQHDRVQALFYASNVLFPLSLGLSKASICLFLLRVTPVKRQCQCIIGLGGLIGVWTIAAVISVALSCGVSHPWLIVGYKCTDWLLTWTVLEVFACVFELVIILLALWTIWAVRMAFAKKAIVISAFSFRLAILLAVGFRLGSFNKAGFDHDFMLLEASYICWTQTEMNYSIISATIPNATKLAKSLSTHWGVAHGVTTEDSYGYRSNLSGTKHSKQKGGESIPMRSLKSLKSLGGSRGGKDRLEHLDLRDEVNYSYHIAGPQQASGNSVDAIDRIVDQHGVRPADAQSVGSSESQQMMIRKNVTYQVRSDSVPA